MRLCAMSLRRVGRGGVGLQNRREPMRWNRMVVVLVLGTSLGWSVLASAQGDAAASVVFVLDCSQSMSESWEDSKAVRETGLQPVRSRFDAARDAMLATLTKFTQQGNYEVGVVLFGHRLAWDGSDQPQILEQTAYLDQTLGYGALGALLPGDDVEVILPIKRFGEVELDQLSQHLQTVQAWGEDPLYYAVVKALDSFSGRRNSTHKSIVVLTDGNNRQWLARNRWTRDTLGDLLDKQNVSIHFIGYGIAPDGQSPESVELAQIAERSRGSFESSTAAALLSPKWEAALVSTRQPAAVATENPAGDANGEAKTESAEQTATEPRDLRNTVHGTVVLYSEPVKKAVVTLEGSDLPPAKTDKSGNFVFRDVVPGKYVVRVEGIAYNVIYNKSQNISVEPAPARGAVVEISIQQ